VRAGLPHRRATSGKVVADKQVDSVCPYCGVGCQLTYNVKGSTILYVEGRDGPASSRWLFEGRYGFDYAQHRHRLTKPLIRKPGVPKQKNLDFFALEFDDPLLLQSLAKDRPGLLRGPPRHLAYRVDFHLTPL
jgi:NADH dehydrogenase/NADH:ubiquinone oxidoreductase subunit G